MCPKVPQKWAGLRIDAPISEPNSSADSPAASAAAAAAGIPLTRRLTARRLQFVTGHDVTGALPEELNIAALADPEATTAIYMGRRTFAKLAQRLIDAGLPEDMPAMLAQGVSTPEQSLHRSTMAALVDEIDANTSDAPGLILFGPLADED